MPAPTLDQLAGNSVDLASDPYPLYAMLRARGPVHRVHVPGSGDAWLVVSHEAARAALTHPGLRNDIRHSATWESDGGHAIGRNMLQSDPPHHTRLRGLVAGHFTPGRIAALRPRIESIAGELLDQLPHRARPDTPATPSHDGARTADRALPGTIDLVAHYALPLPVAVICELLGIPPEDRTLVHIWSNELVMPTSPDAAADATARLTGRLHALTAEGATAPAGTLLAELTSAARRTAPPDSGPASSSNALTPDELLGMVFLLLVAGHETTVNLISATVHTLLTHPAELDRVTAEPALIPAAVEESLRLQSPVHATAFRFAAQPLTLAGTAVAAGDSVLVSLAAASRDPLAYPDPDRFDLERRTGRLGFGHGVHHCLGAPLARAEAAVAVGQLLGRHPRLTPATAPAALTWRTGTLLRGLAALPVRLGGAA